MSSSARHGCSSLLWIIIGAARLLFPAADHRPGPSCSSLLWIIIGAARLLPLVRIIGITQPLSIGGQHSL